MLLSWFAGKQYFKKQLQGTVSLEISKEGIRYSAGNCEVK